jgi:hypothetical protein
MLAIAFCWPLGVLLVAAIILGLCKALSSTTYDPLSPRLGQSLILIFSAAAFFALVSLVAAREIAEAPRSSGGFVPYFGAFIGTPRYLVPLHYLLLGPAAIVLTYLARSRRITTVACSAVVIAAVIAQLEFQRTPMRSVMPATRVSHYSAWRLVLATARQCRAAGLPMPNLPLGALTMEFADENIESFLPLLRHDLALRPDDKLDLIAWPLGAPENASRYAAIRPLKELERQLNLWPLHHN